MRSFKVAGIPLTVIAVGLLLAPSWAAADDQASARKDAILEARMATSRGDFAACIEALRRIRGTPEHRLLGFCYEAIGNDDKALQYYRLWLAKNGSSMQAPAVRARIVVLERAPVVALEREARDLMLKGDFAGCVSRMDDAIKRGSTSWHQLGVCHERGGDRAKAIAAYTKWLAGAPDDETAALVRRKLDKLQSEP